MKDREAVVCFAGARDHYQGAVALQEAGLLAQLVTDSYFDPRWVAALPRRAGNHLAKRSHHSLPGGKVTSSLGAVACEALVKARIGVRQAHLLRAGDAIGRKAGQLAERIGVHLVAYSYYAAAAFAEMRRQDVKKISFQVHPSVSFLREIFEQDMELEPEGRESLMQNAEMNPLWAPRRVLDDSAALDADGLICASEFSARSLRHLGVKNTIMIRPYGVDVSQWRARRNPPSHRHLRIAFVGSFNQRKGVRYLLRAVAQFPQTDVELVVFTRSRPHESLFKSIPDVNIVVHRGLQTHEVAEGVRSCDMLALPSIAEGFGLVILEAMACGVPVLTTPNTGGPEVVRNDVDGFIVPIRDPEAIAQVVQRGLRDRDALFEMGRRARKSAEALTWQRYRAGFASDYSALI